MLLNSAMSDLMDVIMEVPWGSIRGPLLFMLIVNELTGQCAELSADLSADGNTCLGESVLSPSSELGSCLIQGFFGFRLTCFK